jgi:CHAT domain-containing protein
LLAPLAAQVRDRPLVLVPTGPLQWLPWSLLPSCRGRAVSVVPSATLWHRAAAVAAPLRGVVAVAGPDLPHAPAEARAVAALHEGAELLEGPQASADAVKDALARNDVAHVAAHGAFRGDNPLFSCLRLADGPLTVYELESLPSVPRVVILAACDSAQSAAVTGDELLGVATTFLTLGSSALVASVVSLPDGPSVPIMTDVHRRLRSGLSVAAALAQTQSEAADDPDLMPAATGLLCLGAGHVGGLGAPAR